MSSIPFITLASKSSSSITASMSSGLSTFLNYLLLSLYRGCAFLISSLYNLIFSLADINLFESKVFDTLKNNIVSLIGLFLVFKFAISVVNYILDPDKLSDKSTGAQKILTKVVIVIVLLVTVDNLFKEAYKIQNLIMKGGVIEKIVFSDSSKENPENFTNSKYYTTADYLAYVIVAPFFDFNREAEMWGEDNHKLDKDECTDILDAMKPTDEVPKSDCCREYMDNEMAGACDKFNAGLTKRNIYSALIDVYGLTKNQQNFFTINALGVVVAIAAAIILVIIAVGVATRVFKLIFFQIIAPLPIILYIDPKAGKDSPFNKWLKATVYTFLELFIRLFVLYFVILIITKVVLADGQLKKFSDGSSITLLNSDNILMFVFLMIGLLLFASQLPNLLNELFNLNMGGFTKDGKSTAAVIGGITGLAGGAIGGAVSNAVGHAQIATDVYKANHGGKLGIAGRIYGGAQALTGGVTGLVGGAGRSTGQIFKGAKLSDGGISGLNLGSGFNIGRNTISGMGKDRKQKYTTYTDSSGEKHYVHTTAVGRKTHSFLEMANVKDNITGYSKLDQNVRDSKNEMEKAKRELERLENDRNAEYEKMIQERDNTVTTTLNQYGYDNDLIETMMGNDALTVADSGHVQVFSYDSTTKEFKVVKTDADITKFTYNDYMTNYNAKRAAYEDDLKSKGKNATEIGVEMANFDSRYKINNQHEFDTIKSSIDQFKPTARNYMTTVRKVDTAQQTYKTAEKRYTANQKSMDSMKK